MKIHSLIGSISSRLAKAGFMLLAITALAACNAAPAAPSQNTLAPVDPAAATATLQGARPAQPTAVPVTPTTPATALPTAAAPATALPALTPTATSSPVACSAPAALTPAVTEGPFFKANTPERTSLMTPGLTGTPLTLTGYVLTSECQPVAHALLEFWQANAQGEYDNAGYTLRGHQYTDASGRYQLLTVNPGLYPGRTEHIHVKVQAPGGPVLTSQLFFPNVAGNTSDSIFTPALLVKYQGNASGGQANFNFIITLK